MHVKSILAGAAIALVAGVGSVSADEGRRTANSIMIEFATLDGIQAARLGTRELANVRGAHWLLFNPEGTVTLLGSSPPEMTLLPCCFHGHIHAGDPNFDNSLSRAFYNGHMQ